MKKVIGIIPARYGSTRFKGKVLADLWGKPIIQHVYERAIQSKLMESIIVATDDQRIKKAVESFGGNAIMTSTQVLSGTDRIAVVAKSQDADIIVNIQGDEPLIDSHAIDSAIRPLLDDDTITMATLAKKITNEDDLFNKNVVKVVLDKSQFALYFSRSLIPGSRDPIDITTQTFYKHIGIYVYQRDFLMKFTRLDQTYLEQVEKLEQLRVLENGYKIKVVITDYQSIGVDTREDLEFIKQNFNEV